MMWKNMLDLHRPQLTIKYIVEKVQFACPIAKARIEAHTHNI
jgi:hypothetical protein